MSDMPRNPMHAARRLAKPEPARRFYKKAEVGPHPAGFAVFLDGKIAKTPARKPLAVANHAVADALAAEWEAQGERLDPASMPQTRIVNAAIDRVAGEMGAVRADVVKYAGTDLICYRAEGPQALIEAQEAAWGPLVAWAREALGARFVLAGGVVHVAQDAAALAAIEKAISPFDALRLSALHTVTTITGSAIIALAVSRARLSTDQAWAAACVDEDWQAAQWGRDEVLLAARALRRREMDAAAMILRTR